MRGCARLEVVAALDPSPLVQLPRSLGPALSFGLHSFRTQFHHRIVFVHGPPLSASSLADMILRARQRSPSAFPAKLVTHMCSGGRLCREVGERLCSLA